MRIDEARGEPEELGEPAEPAEHARFAEYLDDLQQVADADEFALVRTVLGDPDRAMAQSAVVRHVDRRAADLHRHPAFVPWAEEMTAATGGRHPFLTRRLEEWALFRAMELGRAWRPDALLNSSDWLQRKAAETSSNATVLELLAVHGRTKRIRATADGNRPGRDYRT
ncbi:hypothetical protein ACGFMM_23225 [Streptomyces sp. NPDC048604]|uniref:hypothetical protein n=1 Tax=Streptomyces sp. NPDC048604 TaxID=3365578 RepID=UPI003719DCC1